MDKARIDKLIDVYLNDLVSLRHDAGWHGDSMLARMITYRGQPPPPSGRDQADLAMIYETTFLRATHELLPLALIVVNRLMDRGMPVALAVLAKRFYQHDFLDHLDLKVKPYTDAVRAREIGQSLRTFERNVAIAYERMDEILCAIIDRAA